MKSTLDKVKEGQKCRVINVNIADNNIKKRYLDLGITRGVVVTVIKQGDKDGLVIVSCFNCRIALFKDDLAKIDVEILEKKKNYDEKIE